MAKLPDTSDSDVHADAGPPPKPFSLPGRPRLLVSACLLGEQVRYDGGHKRDPFLVDNVGRFVEWERVCPEADCGLGIPRPSMHLVGDPARPRLVASKTGADQTERMERFARQHVRQLEEADLCGYVCKKGSPSSGMERVRVYDEGGAPPRRIGTGIFTRVFMERFPDIPVEEEGRLHDPFLREHFIERVFAMRRWKDLVASGRSRGRLVEFHADHKYQLLSHSRPRYEELGRLVARAKELRTSELYDVYRGLFMVAMAQQPTAKKRTDVLMHMMGYFKRDLDADEKQELLDLINQYAHGVLPLIVPVTLLNHYVLKYEEFYLQDQTYLKPHPIELKLRNHA